MSVSIFVNLATKHTSMSCVARSIVVPDKFQDGWTARSGPSGYETGDRATVEGTIGQPLVGDLSFQEPCGVHLNAGLETLFRGPVLSLFPIAGWATRDRSKLRCDRLDDAWSGGSLSNSNPQQALSVWWSAASLSTSPNTQWSPGTIVFLGSDDREVAWAILAGEPHKAKV